jgi:predicted lipoprotein with Yx(FWY)xxD motif
VSIQMLKTNRSGRSRLFVLPLALAAAGLLAAACSSSSTTTSAGGASTHTTGTGASNASTTSALVHSGSAGNVGVVLTNTHGLTLYRLTTDHGSSTCSGGCASTWPPLTVSSGTKATAVSGVNGTFGTIKRSDGTTQVTYNGWPLYTFAGDTKAGQANGQGISGTWFAVTPNVTSAMTTGASSNSTTTTSSGNGYSGY